MLTSSDQLLRHKTLAFQLSESVHVCNFKLITTYLFNFAHRRRTVGSFETNNLFLCLSIINKVI